MKMPEDFANAAPPDDEVTASLTDRYQSFCRWAAKVSDPAAMCALTELREWMADVTEKLENL
jgi:hypothetical protein